METNSKHMEMTGSGDSRLHQTWLTGLWHFIRHFIEMCLAMCIGGVPLIILFFWGAGELGAPDLILRSPELAVLAVAVILSGVMIAWMRIRHHEWQPTLEMSGATIALSLLLIGSAWAGFLSNGSIFDWFTRLACPSMLVPMLFRLDMYTGRTGHHH